MFMFNPFCFKKTPGAFLVDGHRRRFLSYCHDHANLFATGKQVNFVCSAFFSYIITENCYWRVYFALQPPPIGHDELLLLQDGHKKESPPVDLGERVPGGVCAALGALRARRGTWSGRMV